MTHSLSTLRAAPTPRLIAWVAGALLVIAAGFGAREALIAQVEGDRGIPPVAATGDISIGGIAVDVTADNAEEARLKGWQEGARLGWEKLGGPKIPDSQIQSMVSSIVIEHEQIGFRRYIASLGVVFDRTRAGPLLGTGGPIERSAPLLLVPVLYDGGTQTVFEVRNPWQRAWAEFQAGASPIDYVRPAGSGGESLLLTYGQTERRSRLWWRNILDEFGAADVIIPIAHLRRQWPGGPVEGTFTARYGPDNKMLGQFKLNAANEDGVPKMMEQALLRLDGMFAKALQDGLLQPDPTLVAEKIDLDPTLMALIAIGKKAEAGDKAATDAIISGTPGTAPPPTAGPAASNFTVQFATPDASAFDSSLTSVRSTPGVRAASTSSTAIGGVSVMSVSYGGSLSELAAALRARGFKVTEGKTALSISR